MTAATTTTLGEIVLGGDLTGNANAPELVSTGVVPGVYPLIQKCYVDSKGRLITIAPATYAVDVEPLLSVATDTTKGIFSLSSQFSLSGSQVSLPNATSSVNGAFSVGNGMTVSGGVVSLNADAAVASGATPGFVKIGSGLQVSSGTVSIQNASDSLKGVFSAGSGLDVVAGEVRISEQNLPATGGSFGFVQPSTNITNTSGTISVPDATTSVKGIASFSPTDFSVSSGAVSIPYSTFTSYLNAATGAALGVVIVGGGFDLSSGTISVPDASTSVKGIARYNSTDFSVSSGAVSNLNVATTGVANTYTGAQNASTSAQTLGGTTFTPNFQTGAVLQDITLSGNLTINFPSTLAPAGTFVRMNIILRYSAGAAYTVTLSGSYRTNRTITFTNAASAAQDVLTLICSDTDCYAILNETFQ